MFGLFTIFRLGPREFIRQKFKLPVIVFVHGTIELFRSKSKAGISQVRTTLFRGTVVSFITSLLAWLSILMYLAFYYAYIPKVSNEKPVFLQFKACETEKGICSFPSAHVELARKQQLLMLGQTYKVHLDLEMPESPANRNLGMFMVCADFHGRDGKLLTHSCRSAMMHYRSSLLDMIYTVIFSPLLLFGSIEEKQNLHIELFSDYQEIENQPVTDVYIEIQTRHIELYSAKFLINAHFTGLRYVMFNWPIISAAIGITSNLFFIAVICMISWYQLIHSEEYKNYLLSKQKLESFEELGDDGFNKWLPEAAYYIKIWRRYGGITEFVIFNDGAKFKSIHNRINLKFTGVRTLHLPVFVSGQNALKIIPTTSTIQF